MMNTKVIITLFLIGLFSPKTWAQGFMRTYNIPYTYTNNGIGITTDSASYTIITNPNSSLTGYICTGVINTNTDGIKQWDNLLESSSTLFSPSRYFDKISDTTYLLSGGIGYPGVPWQTFVASLNTQNNTFQVAEYGTIDLEEGILDVILYNDTLIAGVSYGDVNPYTYSHIRLVKICPDLTFLEEIDLNNVSGYAFNIAYYLLASNDNHIYMPIWCRNNTSQRYLVVRKIDLQGSTVWEYPLNTYTQTYTNTSTNIIELYNGNIVTRWFDEGAGGSSSERKPYLICLSPDGEFVWRYNFDDSGYRKFPIQITFAANGDIIGCGYTQNPNYNYDCGWLFRISPDGGLIWEREYISHTPIINFLVPQGIDEDPYGNIIATGVIIEALPTGGYDGNALLLKVLPNGCFTPGCNGGAEDTLIIASTVVGVDSPPKPLLPAPAINPLVLFPNPANGVVQILLPAQRQYAQIRFYDLSGRMLKTVPVPDTHYNQHHIGIDTDDLPDGVCVVSYEVGGQVFATAKLVVTK